jgi:hypothetical protein
MRILLFLPILALAACATVPTVTPAQGMYAALGAFESAQHVAADYAESPTADPAIIHKIATIKNAPATQAAVRFGEAFRACDGRSTTVVPGLQCSMFDFSAASLNTYAVSLRGVAAALLTR